jgi:hypothetical protein
LKYFYHGTLYDIYYKANTYKNAIKTVNKVFEYQEELKTKEQTDFIGDEKQDLIKKIEIVKKEAADSVKKIEKIKNELEKINFENDNPLKKVITSIDEKYKKENIDFESINQSDEATTSKRQSRFVDQFPKLNKRERKIIDKRLDLFNKPLNFSVIIYNTTNQGHS